MFVNKRLGLGNGLNERGSSIRELTNEELAVVTGGEGDQGPPGSGEPDQGSVGGGEGSNSGGG